MFILPGKGELVRAQKYVIDHGLSRNYLFFLDFRRKLRTT